MEAKTTTINEVISSNTMLKVPFFQRRYVWEEDDWRRFADDMFSTIHSTRNYFLGAIILKEELRNEDQIKSDRLRGIAYVRQIIDGQQRLTTLAIYMKILHLLTNKDTIFRQQYMFSDGAQSVPVISHNCDDRRTFQEIMNLDTLRDVRGDGRIKDAYDFFRHDLRGRNVDYSQLLNVINSSIKFVAITLSAEDDEQQIFDTLNSLGEPLTTDELMKNFLYTTEEDEQAYKDNWYPMFDTNKSRMFWESDAAKSRQAKNKNNILIERFFHAFVRIKMWSFNLSDEEKRSFVKIDNTYVACKAFVERYGMNRQSLANEIISYAKLYKENLNSEILDMRIPSYSCIKRISCFINATENYAVTPFVLYVLHENQDYKDQNRLFDFLETYLIRRVLSSSNNNSYSDLFAENLIGNHCSTYNSFKDYIDKRDGNLSMPTEQVVKIGLKNPTKAIKEITARTVYYLYETKLTQAGDPNGITGGFNDFMAIPLMPAPNKRNQQTWPACQDEYDEENRKGLVGTIGNQVLVDNTGKKDLKKSEDLDCATKVQTMMKWSTGIRSNNFLTPQRGLFLNAWNSDDISDRNDRFANFWCNNIWVV